MKILRLISQEKSDSLHGFTTNSFIGFRYIWNCWPGDLSHTLVEPYYLGRPMLSQNKLEIIRKLKERLRELK